MSTRPKQRANVLIVVMLFTATALAKKTLADAASKFAGQEANLPTVIVRGFLNYRTTVDGTVLLFTPDAAGSASSFASSSALLLQSTTAPIVSEPTIAEQIRPTKSVTSVEQQSTDSVFSAFQSTPTVSDAELSAEPAPGEWRPIEATPPLRKPLPISTSIPKSVTSLDSSLNVRQISTGEDLAGRQMRVQSPTPAPKIVSFEPLATDSTSSQYDASTSSAPTVVRGRPRRPSLGFRGQNARGQSSATSDGKPGTAVLTSSAPPVSLLRRPSAAFDESVSGSTVGVNASASAATGIRAFAGRLSAAKVRSRLRRPGQQQSVGNETTVQAVSAKAGNNDNLHAAIDETVDESAQLVSRMGDIFNLRPALLPARSSLVAADEAARAPPTSPVQDLGGQLISGGVVAAAGDLQAGQLSNAPMAFDGFFSPPALTDTNTNDQTHASDDGQISNSNPNSKHGHQNRPKLTFAGASGDRPLRAPLSKKPALQKAKTTASTTTATDASLSHHLNGLISPSFQSNIPVEKSGSATTSTTTTATTPSSESIAADSSQEGNNVKPAVGGLEVGDETSALQQQHLNDSTTTKQVQLQTITKTYSTIMTSIKTRVAPFALKSGGTAVHTITENFVITKMLTSYQTLPEFGDQLAGESLTLNTRAPFEMFNEPSTASDNQQDSKRVEQAIVAQLAAPADQVAQQAPSQSIEMPISLQESAQKSGPDWLHDFTNLDSNVAGQQQQQKQSLDVQQQSQQQLIAALLDGSAQTAGQTTTTGNSLEQLEQLGSSLATDVGGNIVLPDLNNPLVLAAAIQNPQLAAVILAAQQLQLQKQRARLAGGALPGAQNQLPAQALNPALALLQPSYSTSLSTSIKPTTYVVRDTMYTTRLVSFKDGRTVRTRTVSEPGSVVEQTLTTLATEVRPVTIAIRPTAIGTNIAPTAIAGGVQQVPVGSQTSPQATINNALLATQLAALLARRQQQSAVAAKLAAAASTPTNNNQLAALQQFLAGNQATQPAKQFQPQLDQLLQNAQAQSSSTSAAQHSQSDANSNVAALPTPALPPLGPLTTTITSLQVRTYTVHNAFKTIYRTITSTTLVTSTILPAPVAQQAPIVRTKVTG